MKKEIKGWVHPDHKNYRIVDFYREDYTGTLPVEKVQATLIIEEPEQTVTVSESQLESIIHGLKMRQIDKRILKQALGFKGDAE